MAQFHEQVYETQSLVVRKFIFQKEFGISGPIIFNYYILVLNFSTQVLINT